MVWIRKRRPSLWSEFRKAPDREIGKPRKDRCQIVAHWEFQPAATFHDQRIAATLGPACGLPMCIQFLRPNATGRIEFSARLLLSSSSGYSRNRVSFLHSVRAYWQALLSALEGNARLSAHC